MSINMLYLIFQVASVLCTPRLLGNRTASLPVPIILDRTRTTSTACYSRLRLERANRQSRLLSKILMSTNPISSKSPAILLFNKTTTITGVLFLNMKICRGDAKFPEVVGSSLVGSPSEPFFVSAGFLLFIESCSSFIVKTNTPKFYS